MDLTAEMIDALKTLQDLNHRLLTDVQVCRYAYTHMAESPRA